MLPDQDPPTDFVFAKGTFALDDAAVAAGAAAGAAGVSADALEQQRGKPGVFGILQGNWGQPGTVVMPESKGIHVARHQIHSDDFRLPTRVLFTDL